MLCVQWDHRDVVHFDFFYRNQTLNADLFSQQQQCVYENLQRKRLALINKINIMLLPNNSRPDLAKITQDKKVDLSKSLLSDPPYSPDVASSDFHFFSFFIKCSVKKFSQKDKAKKTFVENFLSLKPGEFYLRIINKLPNKWQKVIRNNGEYTTN